MNTPKSIPTAEFHDERIALGNWFEQLKELDVPTPETQPLPIDHSGEGLPSYDEQLAAEIVENLGGEAFVRADFKAASHGIEAGSHIQNSSQDVIQLTVAELLVQQRMMQMPIGNQIYIREWLNLNWCEYSRSTLHPEVRIFVRDGEVVCHHLRDDWEQLKDHEAALADQAQAIVENDWEDILYPYAKEVAEEFDGKGWYSVDFVCTADTREWYLTDMAIDALYERGGDWRNISSHDPDCEFNLENMHGEVQ